MCIIIVKKPEAKLPSEEILRNCFTRNSDGAGLMYNGADKRVHIVKGFMKFENFKDTFYKIAEDNPKATIVAHCRITTQGGVQQALCHPYPLTHNIDLMRNLKVKCPIGVAHNGIISLTSEYGRRDRNDTMSFISKFLYDIVEDNYFWYKNKHKKHLIQNLIGTNNKLAILDGNGHVELINEFVLDKKTGLLFSNRSFETPAAKPVTIAEGGYKKLISMWDEGAAEDYYLDDLFDTYEAKRNPDGSYEFEPSSCPMTDGFDDEYCDACNCASCECSLKHYRP